MQSFICDYSYDLKKSARLLDGKRLFKMLLENYQILDILVNNKKNPWRNHPTVKQWISHEVTLFRYITSIWRECQNRDIAKNSQIYNKAWVILNEFKKKQSNWPNYIRNYQNPAWWGRPDIISGMRSNLKKKGFADIYCAAIKKHLKLRNINNWLKENFGKVKNQLDYGDVLKLKKFIDKNKIKVYDKNHYGHFKENPRGDYVWPVSIKSV